MEKHVEIKGFVVLKKRGPAKKFSKKFQQIGADVTLTILDDGKKDISLSGSVCPDLLKEILHEVAPYVDEGYISTLVQIDDPVYVFVSDTWVTLKNRILSPSQRLTQDGPVLLIPLYIVVKKDGHRTELVKAFEDESRAENLCRILNSSEENEGVSYHVEETLLGD